MSASVLGRETPPPQARERVDDAARRTLTGARVTALVLTGITAVVTARLAWVGDDALITLRTALNATHGWGWGFNATEAVQGYTHPLWFLIWLALGSVTGNWLLTVMVIGVVLTTAAVLLVLWGGTSGPRVVLVGGLLVLSTAFVEYATSGLENPLGYLLFALVITVLAADETPSDAGTHRTRTAVYLGLLTATLFLTRMDYILLLAPVALLWTWRQRTRPATIAVAAGTAALPVLAWFTWAYTTYGYYLPATYEAKTNLALPRGQLLETGWHYLSFSALHDLGSLVMLVVGGLAVLLWGTATMRAWLLGIVAYLGYVVWIGGDFMIGRFLAVPVLIVAALAVRLVLPPLRFGRVYEAHRGGPWAWAGSVGALVGLALLGLITGNPASALDLREAPRWHGYDILLSDERGGYLEKNGGIVDYLAAWRAGGATAEPVADRLAMINSSLWQIEQHANAWPDSDGAPVTLSAVESACGGLGAIGVLSGVTVHLVDECALTDRFLAGLPGGDPTTTALPGHMRRTLPDGYLDAVRVADPAEVDDPALAQQLAQVWSRIRQSD